MNFYFVKNEMEKKEKIEKKCIFKWLTTSILNELNNQIKPKNKIKRSKWII